MAKNFRPQAAYSELKRVETFIEQAMTIEDLRRIAATESAIGYKALGHLIAGTMTAAQMKPEEAQAAQAQQPKTEGRDAFEAAVEGLLWLEDFSPEGNRPYPYQIDGIRFLVHNEGALLGDEMGLGKTIQAIGGLKVLYRLQRVRRVLILCPRQLISQWEYELKTWAPELFVQKVRGSPQERTQSWRSGATVHITNYETWRNDLEGMPGLNRQYHLVILDEVQKVKQPSAAITMAVGQIKATYRWGLSGTPLENSLDDVVTIYNFLRPGLFRQTDVPYQPGAVKRLIKPYFLRRRLTAVELELPEKIHKDIWLDLTEEQRSTYERVENQSRQQLCQTGVSGIHIFAEISKLKQICSYDAQSRTSSKLDYLIGELESIVANGQKALVFSQFPQVTLRPLQQALQEFSPAIYDGSLSDKQSEQVVAAFQNQATPKLLLTSVKSGGVGLNLTRANQVFHFDHWWNPAIARQAEARTHRIGQEATVVVHSLFTEGTIEEKIYQLLKRKEELFATVIGDLTEKQIVGQLSLEDLFGLFGLEAPKPQQGKQARQKRSDYHPMASYTELKRVEILLKQAQTVDEVRRIARQEIAKIGYKAFCYLLGELSTPKLMKGE